mmetsp:Transcript_6533/g.13518  ORF Transcript_6533/g.13518 Transcript_6533/m.13518 type:complete len:1067 (-) Transcript_6533:207-3407(-)
MAPKIYREDQAMPPPDDRKGLTTSFFTPLQKRDTAETEFFVAAPHERKGSLAQIAQQQVLIRRPPLGAIAFSNQQMESEWLRYARTTYFQRLGPTCASLCGVLFMMLVVMIIVTVYLEVSLPDSPSALQLHVRDDAVRWTIALAVHFGVSFVVLGYVRCRGLISSSSEDTMPTSYCKVVLIHSYFCTWFALWLGTLTFLSVLNKFRRLEADGWADTQEQVIMLSEHARASNNSAALISLVSLGCFMRGFKLSYEQSVLMGLVMLVSTIVSWTIQPAELDLDHMSLSSWTNLVWVVLSVVTEVALVRATEKVRRRLFHLRKVMEHSYTTLIHENKMLLEASARPSAAAHLDFESPVQKVINFLRQLQADTRLLQWQGAIESTIHKLARAKLHDLFLPTAVNIPTFEGERGSTAETEMVEHIVGLGENHRNDADELDVDEEIDHTVGSHTLDDGVAVEDRRRAILKDMARNRFGVSNNKNNKKNGSAGFVKAVSKKIVKGTTGMSSTGLAMLNGGGSGGGGGGSPSLTRIDDTEADAQVGAARAKRAGGGSLSPQPSSLDSPAKASRQADAKILTTETGSPTTLTTVSRDGEVGSGREISPPSRRGPCSCSSASNDSFRTTAGSPSMNASFYDTRLRVLQDSMPLWGCGPRSIFGLQEIFGPDLLFFMLESAFREFDLFEHFSIDAQKLQHLCSAIVAGYNDLPYHNYIHAMDVTHGTYWLLKQRLGMNAHSRHSSTEASSGSACITDVAHTSSASAKPGEALWECIPKYAVCAGLLAAAIHDINHDGYNNAFHVATGSQLAMTYNDKSCLESMHASIGLQLIRHTNNDVLEHMSIDQRRKFRTLSVDMIMGTDLANHFEGLSQIQLKAAEGFKLCGANSDLALLMANVVHAADLGSTANPPPVYFDWMQRVFREFFFQGEREREAKIPLTPFMDRSTASIPKAQQGFLKYICTPLFRALVEVIPSFQVGVDNANDVIETLHDLEAFTTDEIMGAARLGDLLPNRSPAELEPLVTSPPASARAQVLRPQVVGAEMLHASPETTLNLSAKPTVETQGMGEAHSMATFEA